MIEVMECRFEHRVRAHAVRIWAFGQGRAVDRPSLAVILAVKDDCVDEPFDRWTLDGLADLMWTYVPQWCSAGTVERPKQLAETLWLYLTFLHDSGRLAQGSDDLGALRASLVAYGGLNQHGVARGRGRPRSKARHQRSELAASSDYVAPVIPLRPGMAAVRPPLAAT